MKTLKSEYLEKSSLEIARICARVGDDSKAENISILDVHEISSFADYFVVMSGRSTRHVQGLADAIDRELRNKRVSVATSEGVSEGLWVLLDYEDVVIHIFYSEVREFYDLEGLWHDAPRVEIEADSK